MRKKILLLMLMTLFLVAILCGCEKEIASKEVIDVRFTPSHEERELCYMYIYHATTKTMQPFPYYVTVTKPDKYEVKYLITYVDGTTATKWEEVTETEYKSILDEKEQWK